MKLLAGSSRGLHALQAPVGASCHRTNKFVVQQSKFFCSRSAVESAPTAAVAEVQAEQPEKQSPSSGGIPSSGNIKKPLRLCLGPLQLVEQRFRVSKGVNGRFKPAKAAPSSPHNGAGPTPAPLAAPGEQPLLSKHHSHEFILFAPEDVDEVIDLYFNRWALVQHQDIIATVCSHQHFRLHVLFVIWR